MKHVTIINGSQRFPENSQSYKLTQYFQGVLLDGYTQQVQQINMTDKPYPLWDESVWQGDADWQALLKENNEILEQSDAFIILAPEYHGMAPAALKNFLLLHGKQQLAHKPALLVGVSSGDGGAYPLAEMRMNSAKNNRLCYIPEQLIIRNVESVLNPNASDNIAEADTYFRERITFSLNILNQYASALTLVRESAVTFDERFSNGM
ncbi:MAG: NAD(P)H-dependent oxidoreductase [Thiotrichaceae bacterium]|nr:NAD(P)H-dependent oxidoreductase [Thiotrichaceae bacterium]